MAKTVNRTKVARYYWFRPRIARILREYTETERRPESEQVEIFIEEGLQRRGLLANPRRRPKGGDGHRITPLLLAALIGGVATQARADQVDPVSIMRSWRKKVSKSSKTAGVLPLAA